MGNIIFFDTETTGKPKDYKGSMRDLDNWPRVIQLAWAVYTGGGELILKHSELIKPDGWEIPKEKFWIDNGYSTEKNEAIGVPMSLALWNFIMAARECTMMAAHNIQFDYNVLGAEMIRYNMGVGRKLEQFCTMEQGTAICKIPSSRGYKWPTLMELHKYLYGEEFKGAHDALADVEACARCYFRMMEIASDSKNFY
jgi:DNA polymerase-3 subunit epsilon